ncbi:hypothetical protein ES707_00216 [subsurface metagenome]
MATEEQTLYESSLINLQSEAVVRGGQRLTVPNLKITKLGFWLQKSSLPTGTLTLRIRKIDDAIILTKDWGDAEDVPTEITYLEVEFDTPAVIDEEVRVLAEFSGGDPTNHIKMYGTEPSVKPDEHFTYYSTSWSFLEGFDMAYIYTYGDEEVGLENKSANMASELVAAGLI